MASIFTFQQVCNIRNACVGRCSPDG